MRIKFSLLHHVGLIITLLNISPTAGFTITHRKRSERYSTNMASSSDDDELQPTKHVVIAGGGVIGTCTAYYLARNFGISVSIVDPSGKIAPAASGKAGGFLALDWNDMSPIRHLARRSFALHQTLADALGAENIQYRRLTCASIGVDANRQRPGGKKVEGIEWAQNDAGKKTGIVSFQMLGDTESIAQVHPKMLCQSLWDASCSSIEERRKKDGRIPSNLLKKGKVVSMEKGLEGRVRVVLDDDSTLTADAVLLACGPWTANIMSGVKYHSVVIPTEKVLSQCVFFAGCGDPEVYVRPDSTAYCTGFPDQPMTVTERPGEEEVRPDAVERIVTAVRQASGETENGVGTLTQEPILTQACYLPSTPDGLPIMGVLPKETVNDCNNCFVAAGHSCWGILLGPATGETMANLIATGQTSTDFVNLGPFQPSRFRNIKPLA